MIKDSIRNKFDSRTWVMNNYVKTQYFKVTQHLVNYTNKKMVTAFLSKVITSLSLKTNVQIGFVPIKILTKTLT